MKKGLYDTGFGAFALISALIAAFCLLLYRLLGNADAQWLGMAVVLLLKICSLSLVVLALLQFAAVFLLHFAKRIPARLLPTARALIGLFLPLLPIVSALLGHSSPILRFYIALNNKLVLASNRCYAPDGVLILLPHCLQNAKCPHKVTGCIDNCKECMGCTIGSIKELAKQQSIGFVEVVGGGTSARATVGRIRPALIVAVACERDLAAGIGAVGAIPTVGILNRRPNGPCFNTTVSMTEFSETLETLLNETR